MRKIYLPLCLIIFFLFCATDVPAADLKAGFLGIKWGDPVLSVGGLSSLYRSDQVGYYVRPNVIYQLNERHMSQVVYGFYTNKFFASYVSFESWEALSDIRKNMRARYGSPKIKIRRDHTVYRWKHGKIKIKLKVWEIKGAMKLAFYYTPLSDKLNEEIQDKNFDSSLQILPIDKNKKYKAVPLLIF